MSADEVTVTVCPDGPLLLRGPARLLGVDGSAVEHDRSVIALCRCGNRRCPETVAGASTAHRLAEDLAGRPVSLSDLVQGPWPATRATAA